jgi:hypothetical protein
MELQLLYDQLSVLHHNQENLFFDLNSSLGLK